MFGINLVIQEIAALQKSFIPLAWTGYDQESHSTKYERLPTGEKLCLIVQVPAFSALYELLLPWVCILFTILSIPLSCGWYLLGLYTSVSPLTHPTNIYFLLSTWHWEHTHRDEDLVPAPMGDYLLFLTVLEGPDWTESTLPTTSRMWV